MKKGIRVLGLFLIILFSGVIFPKKSTAQGPYVSYQVFYDQLSPYGQWVNFQNYGYVWLPDAGWDFVPYSTGGYWIMTEYGWTWLSEYDWGWAPFHYGRWDFDDDYGWFWIPGNEWGPAWVTWRRASGYYGWSPMRPGINISMNFGNGYDNYNNYDNHWIFVNDRYFGRNDIFRHYANQNDYDIIFRSSVVINNTYIDNNRHTTYYTGPDPADVRRATGRTVSSYSVHEYNRPGQELSNRDYRTYRPEVINSSDQQRRAVPNRVISQQDIRRPAERNPENLYRSNTGLQVQQQNEKYRQDEINRRNAIAQQNAVNHQNAINQRNAVNSQNEINRQNEVNRQNDVRQQDAVNQQNAVYQQNAARRQSEINRQDAAARQYAIDRQNAANLHNEVNKQNAANRQKAVDQENAIYRKNEINRQKAAEEQQNEQKNINGQNSRRENSGKTTKVIKGEQSEKTKIENK